MELIHVVVVKVVQEAQEIKLDYFPDYVDDFDYLYIVDDLGFARDFDPEVDCSFVQVVAQVARQAESNSSYNLLEQFQAQVVKED